MSLIAILIGVSVLVLVVLSERFWFLWAWRFGGRRKSPILKYLIRSAAVLTFGLLVVGLYLDVPLGRTHIMWRSSRATRPAGLWISSALLAYVAVQMVACVEWVWRKARRRAPGGTLQTL